MKIGIQGSRNFSDYNIFLRAMRVALSDMREDDKQIVIYSAGPVKTNSFGMEFTNISENSLKARGISIKFIKGSIGMMEDLLHELDYFAYLSEPKEPKTPLVKKAEDKDVEVGWFRF